MLLNVRYCNILESYKHFKSIAETLRHLNNFLDIVESDSNGSFAATEIYLCMNRYLKMMKTLAESSYEVGLYEQMEL